MKRRILIVSLGSIGQRHLRNIKELLPDADICIFRHKPPAQGVEASGDLKMVYRLVDALAFKPDGVILASPASKHADVARAFLETGANIFIEKPLEANLQALSGLTKAVEKSAGFVMVGYVLRFLPALNFIKQELDKGLIGDVRSAIVQTGQYLPDWRPGSDYRDGVSAQKALGGGVLLELSHELDYASWLFGLPSSLFCSAATLSDLDIEVEDCAHILFEYPQKRVAIQIDFLNRVAQMSLQIVGSKATLNADLIKETVKLITPEAPEGVDLEAPKSADGNEVYLRQFDVFFVNSFKDYTPRFSGSAENNTWVSVAHGEKIIEIVDAAKISNRLGQRVVFAR